MPLYNFLFLDRDGVINKRLPKRYVEKPKQFEFAEGVLEAFPLLKEKFERIFVVTNQQGIGKGIMTAEALYSVHQKMQKAVQEAGGKIDAIHFSPNLATDPNSTRKPAPDMALQIRQNFPEVDFKQSIMVGDSVSDMLFGKRLNMKTIMITTNPDEVRKSSILFVDAYFESLAAFANSLT